MPQEGPDLPLTTGAYAVGGMPAARPGNRDMARAMIDDTETHDLELRSFGRRRGRKLSTRQERLLAEFLPRIQPDLSRTAPDPAARLFDEPIAQVWLEIGFGGAEHLAWQARHHPEWDASRVCT